MGELSRDMLVPNADNFIFGFNDIKLSDCVLNIEITSEDTLTPLMKKQKLTHPVGSNGSDSYVGIDIKNLNLSFPVGSNDSESYVGIEVKTLHVNSLILAAKSPFFYKLFTNGMMESQGKDVTLRVSSSEHRALMDVLKFMYCNTLSASTGSDLLDVLLIADKFDVSSCMRYCIALLMSLPMSLESACQYVDLPSSVLVNKVVQPLIDTSNQYLVGRYRDFNKSQEELIGLPLCALEVVLVSDGFRVDSEDDKFDFILKWALAHYPVFEERREIITKRLTKLMRFPYMSSSKLNEVRNCFEIDFYHVSNLVMDALFYKLRVLSEEDSLTSKEFLASEESRYSGCLYHDRLVNCPRRVVNFNLERKECAQLFGSKRLYSKSFLVGGRWFILMAQKGNNFGLYLKMAQGSETCNVDLKFAVMKKSSNKFDQCKKSDNIFVSHLGKGWNDLFGISWTTFMSDDSDYFIERILHLRADITVNSQA